jgi:Tol biopolymer transport system component
MLVKKKVKMLVALLTAALTTEAHASSVRADGGNISTVDDAGVTRQLTRGGLDSAPAISPDGRHIAFVRKTRRKVDTALGPENADEIWLMNIDGSAQRLLVEGHNSTDPKRALAALHSLIFSPDGRVVYFLSSAWTTSGSVHAVDLATAEERFVTAGNSLDVIPTGQYAGDLIVNQHRYWLAGGSYDWFWLVSPAGKDRGPIGADSSDVEHFKSLFAQ